MMSKAGEFIFETLPLWLEYFVEYVGGIVESMMLTPNEVIALAIQQLPENVANIFDGFSLPGATYNTPLIFWFFGVGLLGYLVYQFVIWLLNIIT